MPHGSLGFRSLGKTRTRVSRVNLRLRFFAELLCTETLAFACSDQSVATASKTDVCETSISWFDSGGLVIPRIEQGRSFPHPDFLGHLTTLTSWSLDS